MRTTTRLLSCVALVSAVAIAPAMAKGPTPPLKGAPSAGSGFQAKVDPLGPKAPVAASTSAKANADNGHYKRIIKPPQN